jgi:hypothetical protein
MDPFLEHPELFPDLHGGMIFCMQEMLQSKLPEHYYAATGSRVWVELAHRHRIPDVNVLKSESPL